MFREHTFRARRIIGASFAWGVIFCCAGGAASGIDAKVFSEVPQSQAQQQGQSSTAQQNPPPVDPAARKSPDPSSLPASSYAARGKKLIMKDGSYQLVRSYEKNGDVVRYYSVERSQWEEIPAALVDFDATAKASEKEKNQAEELISKVEKSEAQHNATEVVDVDASLEVKPGILLPAGEGLFLVDGKSVTLLNQVRTNDKLDKRQAVIKVLVPVPVVSSKRRMQIPGRRAEQRVTAHDPEFYLRIPFDSSDEPELDLMNAEVKGDTRLVELIRTDMMGKTTYERRSLSLQRWEVAQGVYRFTLGEPLPAGEYALAVILPEGIGMYVWDFGVDAAPAAPDKKQ